MPTGSFEKNSWSWQLSQLQQQIGEWLELQFSRFQPVLPKWSDKPTDDFWVGLLQAAGWLLLSLFLLWLGWQMWRQFSSIYSLLTSKPTATTSRLSLTAQEWLQRSRSCLSKGNYREACRCLYLATLQRLDDTEIAAHQPSRTDGEYLRLIQRLPQAQSYQTLITAHEQLCFGNTEISPETFDQCWQAYREIEGQ